MATEGVAQPRGQARPRERARTRAEEAAAEAASGEATAITGEAVSARVSVVEWTLYGAFVVIGAIMRFWDLGARALHHDESLHATYSWYLYKAITWNFWAAITGTNPGNGYEYHYDPMMHGPYQFHGNALMYLIFGPSDASVRFNAAICGTALIALPFLLRRQIGRVGALLLSGLMAFSPAFLYYSRFSREDIYFALWTAVFFVGVMRWIDARGRAGTGNRWLYMAAAGYALAWSTKESTFFVITPIILGFIIGIFVIAYLYQFLAPALPGARGKASGSPAALFVSALGDFSRANLRPLLDAFKGTTARAWWIALGIMAAIIVVLYWPIGDPWQIGFIPGQLGSVLSYNGDAFTGGILYWLGQQAVARGNQPWYYYFLVIPLYEQVAVVFGGAGLVYFLMRKPTRLTWISGAAFLVFTLLTLFAGPSLPKIAYDLLALLMIVSGMVLMISRPRTPLVNLVLWWTVLSWGLYTFAGEKMPWLTLHILLPTYILAAMYLGHLFRAPRWSIKWTVTAVLFALCALVSVRSSVALAYADGANPTEMLIYTQTAQDIPDVSNVMHRIVAARPSEQLWVDQADTWPFVWYLRDLSGHYRWGAGSETDTTTAGNDAVSAARARDAVLVVGSEDHDQYFVGQHKLGLLSGYTGYEMRFRWWFPEDYRNFEAEGLGGFLAQAVQPSTYAHLFNWWLTRTPFDQAAFQDWSNVYPCYVYVRNDLVKQFVPASWAPNHKRLLAADGTPGAVAQTDDVAKGLDRAVAPLVTVNGSALAQPLSSPQGVAVDAAGNMYVTDTATQRVIKLDRAGRYVTSWGGPGAGPGQFSNVSNLSPMGIAVGKNGDVYVSDTWNHRIEEFTPAGKFVRAFGGPNVNNQVTASSFYGPRQLAVAPNGDLLVADTGNKRIQVYSPSGKHLYNIGSAQTLNEPSGVAVDKHGIVYVASYWGRSIVRFRLDGTRLGSYTVAGWPATPGDYKEPYLAVDGKGHLFVDDAPGSGAHVNHVLELDATTGRVLKAFGVAGLGTGTLAQPAGLAVGPDGLLHIVDNGALKVYTVKP